MNKAQKAIDEALSSLKPYLLALTPGERHGLPKMGQKTLSFVEKAHEYAKQNLNFVPPYLDMNEYDKDFADAHGLWGLANSIRQLEEGLDDTIMAAGSEAYKASLTIYRSAKDAAQQDIPGAKAIYEELTTRFPQNRRKKKPTDGEESAASR
ncbi:conserved hypothetical protein [Leadbettera azotonutricia ZAS-9]|uniref:Uncharacterized protein n=1 Tax=Leadbettera azotonutricia (strain ATCC BAA-888 / DSM 13862 / ZAS-9) TaxID=545695 RepID=F5YFZ7_LEAAZ|nr:conserved hypothetical protein [Leadbettera azotonutricia ZAS-9]